jgi:MFS family permease
MKQEYNSFDITRFLIASFLGFLAGHLTNYSVILYAQDVWNSDLIAGVGFALCFGVPLFLGWFAGAWCDSYSPQKLAQLAHISFLISLCLLNIATLVPDNFSKIIFLLGAFFAGSGWAVLAPARMALLGRIAGQNQARLAVIFNILVMLGFGAAPPLLAFCKDIGSWEFVHFSGIILFLISISLLIKLDVKGLGKTDLISVNIKKGLQYTFQNPLLKQTVLFSILIYLSMGPVQVMLPRYAKLILNLDGIDRGFFLGSLALALLIGGGISLKVAKIFGQGKIIAISSIMTGIGLIGIGLSNQLYLSVIFVFVSGIGAGSSISLLVAILQSESSPEYRGRLVSLYTIASQVVPATSGLTAGIVLTFIPVSIALPYAGLILTATLTIGIIRLNVLRDYRVHNHISYK